MDSKNKIVKYMKDGCKKKEDFKFGIELEHFVLDDDLNVVGYEELTEILLDIMDERDTVYEIDNKFMGYFNDDYSISFEPAAQLEISIAPKSELGEIKDIYMEFRKKLAVKLSEKQLKIITYGYNPSCEAEKLSIIPKKRYEYMDKYFKNTGTMGINMMRATAATQVSIDYENEDDAVKKYQLACILSPIFSFITDNCVFFENKINLKNITRAHIWNNVDDERCGILEGCMADDFSFEKYAKYLLETPAIIIGDEYVKRSFGEFYVGCEMTNQEIGHALSMLFFDVRIKNYIEIRMADSMPIQYVLSYTALIKGIFAQTGVLLDYLKNECNSGKIIEEDIIKAKYDLRKNGYDAVVYGKRAKNLIDTIFLLAKASLSEQERKVLRPLKSLTDKRITLKDMEIERVEVLCNSFKVNGKLV